MIEFKQVSKQLGTKSILRDSAFYVVPGSRVGVVGPNGAGKTTLFRLITGEEACDGGDIIRPKQNRLGYLRQQIHADNSGITLLEHASGGISELPDIEARIHKLDHEIPTLSGEEKTKAINQLGELQHQFEDLGGYEIQSRAEAALHGLGFSTEDFSRSFTSFSGGWQMRGEMVRTLAASPDTLLLDEPSNYLDLPAVEWLQRFLREFAGTLLMISHDRFLLRTLTDTTLEIANAQATLYPGGYDNYINQRDERKRSLEAAQVNQAKKREKTEQFIKRFRAQASKASQVQSRVKQLEKMEDIEVFQEVAGFSKLEFPNPPQSSSEMVRLEGAGLSYDNQHWIFRNLDISIQRGDKTAVVGYNGTGKTTLLRVLAGAKDPSEGKRVLGHRVVVGYQSQEFGDTLAVEQTAYQIVAAASAEDSSEKTVRSALGRFGFSGDDVFKTCKVLSGGEKIRLAFARIFVNPPNLLLLDEPTTHLDVQGCEALEEAIAAYKGTVCMVSHDVTFVRRVATSILSVDKQGIRRIHGDYDYYLEKVTGDQKQEPPQTAAPKNEPATPQDKKEARKIRAAQREENRKKSLAVKKIIRTSETRIEELEKEQSELSEALINPETPSTQKTTANRRLYEISIELEKANQAWETAVDQLTALAE